MSFSIDPAKTQSLSNNSFLFENLLAPAIDKIKNFALTYFKEILFCAVSTIPLLILPQIFLGGVVVGAVGGFAVPQYMNQINEFIEKKIVSRVPNFYIKSELSMMNDATTDAISGLFHDKKVTPLSTSIQCIIAASSIIFQGTFLGLFAGIQLGAVGYDVVGQINTSSSPELAK